MSNLGQDSLLKLGLQFFAEGKNDEGNLQPQPNAETIPQIDSNNADGTTAAGVTEPKEPEPQPFKLKVKYNHEEQELDEETARVLAQKGMNYDKVFEDYTNLKTMMSDLSLPELKANAQALGMTVTDYIGYAREYADEANIQKLVDLYGVDYAYAKALYETQKGTSKPAAAEPQPQMQQENPQADDKLDKEISVLYKAHPDVTADDIKAIMDDYNAGVPMVKAYEAYKLKTDLAETKAKAAELEKQLGINQVNETNNQSAVGSVTGGGETIPSDVYTLEEYNALTTDQVNANLDKAMRSMTFWSKKKR